MITPQGRILALVAVGLVAVGWLLGYEEALALGLAGLITLALVLAWVLRRPRLTVRREVRPDRVTVGDDALGLLTVVNDARRPSPPLLAHEQFRGTTLQVALPRLAAGEEHATPYRLPTDRRGIITVGPMELRRSDPFGLVAATQQLGDVDTLWVHPRVHAVRSLPSGRDRDLDGPTSDTAPQGGSAFHALREYVRGDDRRQIHWRSSARTGTLMVRHMVDSSLPVTTVVLDTTSAYYSEQSFEHAVEAAASVTVSALRGGFPVRLLAEGIDLGGPGRPVPPTVFLDALAGVERSPDGGLLPLARNLSSSGSSEGSLVLVTGVHERGDLSLVSRVRRRFARTVVVRFPRAGLLVEDTPAMPGAVVLDVSDPRAFVARWNRMVKR